VFDAVELAYSCLKQPKYELKIRLLGVYEMSCSYIGIGQPGKATEQKYVPYQCHPFRSKLLISHFLQLVCCKYLAVYHAAG
jgi:hypothetical protein